MQLQFSIPLLLSVAVSISDQHTVSYREKWGYVNVRPKAHTFWWLYYEASDTNRPLILWLQGGPGASSTAYGNFGEMGPLDFQLKPRNFTWINRADLVFVDNPVGAGFSYVEDGGQFTRNVSDIAGDLLSWATVWFREQTAYQSRPFYIFCESYGGKMTAAFAQVLYRAIKNGDVKANFKGIALGDSWISPMDYVNSYGPFLYSFSYLSSHDLKQAQAKAKLCGTLISKQDWTRAEMCWSENEALISELTDGVSWYNVLRTGATDPFFRRGLSSMERLYELLVAPFQKVDLDSFMNGPIKKKLGATIPQNVLWGTQSGQVFENQAGDFMKPVIDIVDDLLANTTLQVIIYSGQVDLICNVMGTEAWLAKLNWPHLKGFLESNKIAFKTALFPDQTAGFYRRYENFSFFWILRAGHMVPTDAPDAALKMVEMIIDPHNENNYPRT